MVEHMAHPDIDSAALNRVDRLIDSASRILDRADGLNLFLPGTSRQSRDAMRLIREAATWVGNVKSRFDSFSAGEALSLVDFFDLMHRIACQQPADRAFVNDIILRAFEARIHGDKTVDEYLLYRAIHARIINKDKAFLDRPLSWLCLTLDRWHKEARAGYGKTTLPAYDIISRASILMESDLFAYEGRNQRSFKQHLAATISDLSATISDLSDRQIVSCLKWLASLSHPSLVPVPAQK